ncbi:alpha-1,2-fucosyltransferase [Panacibacter ginsenosidivorans]|uniref:Alpha-1,2-fucosyltransferase n=1 Tax=Panacibacter ginsenosidivorans TaxID=1813871 RepID=A0A5B8VCS1_9BACT|nr:alpha-1,2-fucosyltransferase [Panacibacter ginsenosidivorans]QEC69069.1 alpha-1,2-fucosyltransferase [Panacibacter ginsenosidivorans]
MIIVRISMGLGNQLFQYAAGKALSLEKNVPLKVDIASYGGYKLRNYELEKSFDINTPVATPTEIQHYYYPHPVKRVWNNLFPSRKMRVLGLRYDEPPLQKKLLQAHDLLLPPHKRTTYIEPHLNFDAHFFKANDDIYLQGYWMSWRYFEKYDETIRKIFTIHKPVVAHLENIVDDIHAQNSVSIHIRRTDYTSAAVIALKGQTTMGFYKNAIDIIEAKINNPVYYMFSDDIEWVKENFPMQDRMVHYIDNSISNSAIEDFYLMQQCRHNIITHSTFGWWAAYLNPNKEKMIIAPKKWFIKKSHNDKDICPPSWITIENNI